VVLTYALAGGWDKIDGGQSTLALAILTGCMDAYTISNANFGVDGGAPEFTAWKPGGGGYPSYRENNPSGGSRSLAQVSTRSTPREYPAYRG
jgi:hypothetical protein